MCLWLENKFCGNEDTSKDNPVVEIFVSHYIENIGGNLKGQNMHLPGENFSCILTPHLEKHSDSWVDKLEFSYYFVQMVCHIYFRIKDQITCPLFSWAETGSELLFSPDTKIPVYEKI